MYLRNVFKGNNSMSTKTIYNKINKKFSLLDSITRNNLSFRMTKYDPTKEIEVKNTFLIL